jgi:hypothetical protein
MMANLRIWLSFVSVALTACASGGTTGARADESTPPAGEDVTVSFATTGSVIVDITFKHAADAQHYCASSSLPWAHVEQNGQTLEVPPGPPNYELRYDAGARRAGSHFRFVAFGYTPGMTTHSDPADDWISFWADGDEWIGHGGSADPAFTFEIKFAPDGQSGSFVAHHLRAGRDGKVSEGNQTVDVKGSWQCPFGAAAGRSP